ncbi:DsbA family protein [Nocardioides panacisoli]|uniref:Thioredoxin domain-containing protein n=1 Tax=Nocardioides panacisoli TaxID=627624 RepID=A0ABP7ITP7_9ACTN
MSDGMSKSQKRAATAAALREEQQRRENRRRLITIGAVLAAMVLIVGGAILVSKLQSDKQQSDLESAVPPAGSSANGVTIGPDSAPHTVVIYEDFLCPFCGELEHQTHAKLAELAADGKVQVEYRPFDLLGGGNPESYSERSLNAFAAVLDSAGPEAAKKMHDLLYENQPSESGPFPSDDDLLALAVQAGASESQVKDDIENGGQQDFVDQATAAAQKAGVKSTPTVLVDGKLQTGFSTVDDLATQLLQEVG